MTDTLTPITTEVRRRAAVRAPLAPSVHNARPSKFVVTPDALEIYADWNRQLRVLDPTGRQLLVSVGCALFNARVVIAASGHEPRIERSPDPGDPNLVARLTLPHTKSGWMPIGALDSIIELRQAYRPRAATAATSRHGLTVLARQWARFVSPHHR